MELIKEKTAARSERNKRAHTCDARSVHAHFIRKGKTSIRAHPVTRQSADRQSFYANRVPDTLGGKYIRTPGRFDHRLQKNKL